MTPEQIKAALRAKGYVVGSEGGGGYGSEPGDAYVPGVTSYYYYGPRGRVSASEAAAATGIPEATLTAAESQLVATPEESSSLYPSRGGGGFFSMLTDLVTSPQFMMAASVVAPSILAANAAAAPAAAAAAAPAGAAAAPIVEPGMLSSAVGGGAPAATAFPVTTSPLASMGGPNILMDFPANMIDSSLGEAYNALGVGAGAPAAGAANALAPVVEPGMLSSTVGGANTLAPAAVGAAPAAANALTDVVSPGEGIDASLGQAYNALGVSAGGLPAGAFDTLAKFAKDYGVPLSALISGITGSQAAKSAADVQAQSAREARDLAKQIYEKQVSLQEPFRTAGITAQNQLLTLLGLQGGTQGAEFGRYARPFGMQDFQADPGYAFRLSEGLKALEASRAAKGGLLSGATGKALSRYGQDLASQEYGSAFNRYQTERTNRLAPLGSLMQTGQAAASNQGTVAGQYGTTAGNLTTDIGAVTAGGQLGSARAISNALGAYTNYLGNQNLAQAIRESQYNR